MKITKTRNPRRGGGREYAADNVIKKGLKYKKLYKTYFINTIQGKKKKKTIFKISYLAYGFV